MNLNIIARWFYYRDARLIRFLSTFVIHISHHMFSVGIHASTTDVIRSIVVHALFLNMEWDLVNFNFNFKFRKIYSL